MPSPALTPANVSTKVTTLYALSDPALNAEADSIASDFRAWMSANFALTTPQGDYLRDMNSKATKYYGMQCSLCFRKRLPITLTWPSPVLGYIKWTVTTNDMAVATTSTGALEVTGSLTFAMDYRP